MTTRGKGAAGGDATLPAFADVLRRQRRRAGLTQEELAERAGLSTRAITALERGVNRAPHRTTLELLSDALGLSTEESATFYAAARRHPDASETTETTPNVAHDVAHDVASDDVAAPQGTAADDMASAPVGGFLGATPERPLVARESEMQRVVAALDAVQRGGGRMVLLAGEPGVGKTRLAQEVSLAARRRGFLVVSGRCHEPYQTMPYHPFIEALTAAYGAASSDIREELPRSWPDVARLLPGMAPDRAASRFTRGPEEEQQRLYWSVTRFVQALATWQPVALLLDDLQWADEASLGLLQHLAQHTRASRVFLLCTYRDTDVPRRHPLRRMAHDLAREHLAERVAVGRLSEEGTAALVAAAIGADETPADLAPLIHRHTDGNPFFTVEVLHALMQRAALTPRPPSPLGKGEQEGLAGAWPHERGEIVVPETVKSAIDERLARLSTETQELLREASVLGESFGFEDVAALGQHTEDEVEAALEEAVSAALVQETGPDRYAFNHVLTQQTLYRALPLRRRRRLHLSAGATLEQLPERQRSRRLGDLAWHFTQAEEPARALPYVLLAGDQAQALYAHAEAEGRYRVAVELARTLGDSAQEALTLTRLGSVLLSRARWDEALALLEQAAARYTSLGDNVGLAETLALLYRLYAHRGLPQEGLEHLQPLLDRVRGGEPTRQLASVYIALGMIYSILARQDDLLIAAERATEIALAVGDERVLAEAKGRKGVALGWQGRLAEGRVELQETLQIAHKLGDLETEVIALNNIAHTYMVGGPVDVALAYFDRVVEAVLRVDVPYLSNMTITSRAQVETLLGHWTQAQLDLDRASRIARDMHESAFSADPLVALGRLYLWQGRQQDAVRAVTEGLMLLGDKPDMQVLRDAHGTLAERELFTGQPAAARDRLLPLLDRGEQPEADVTRILWLVAKAYLDLGNLDEAERVAEEALARIHMSALNVSLPDTLRVRAMVAAARGNRAQARELAHQAVAAAEAVRYPYAQAHALHLAGTFAIEDGDAEAARAHLHAALDIFERLGARAAAARVTESLAGISSHT